MPEVRAPWTEFELLPLTIMTASSLSGCLVRPAYFLDVTLHYCYGLVDVVVFVASQ